MARKGKNIYKRKDNRWEGRYAKGHGDDGRAVYGYCYGKTYREALQKVEAAKLELALNGAVAADRAGRLFTYCDEWMELSRSKVRESTYVKYIAIMEKHIKPHLGSCQVRQLTSLRVERFSTSLLEAGLSPKTVRDILTVLRSVFRYISRQYPGILHAIDIVYPKDPHREMRVLTPDEQERLIRFLLYNIDSCKFGVLLALFTGLRIGEVCALRWRDISLTDNTIRVSSTMQRIKNLDDSLTGRTRVIISEPKSDTSARIIPLPAPVARLCAQWRQGCPDAFVLTGSPDHYIEPRALQYKLGKYTGACSLAGVHFHVLRHTFATRCVEVGFEIKSLSEILGHSSPQITLERYVHSSIELKRANMEKLNIYGWE